MATIMTVDDTASMRQMISFTLNDAGFEVMEAEDGVKALEAAKSSKVDMFITDINMPNMDGIALVKELRALPEYKFTPILMLTTESQDNKRKAGKEAGATGWIVKPFNPEQLIKLINQVL
ncbi:MAG: response regulator [Proteobacteria bacterium]|nr:response regulator [Pseudomonadota bacterium]